MNTPIQELLEYIERNFDDTFEILDIKSKANLLLKKEKDIIIGAFEEGYSDAHRKEDHYPGFECYYTQNFSNDAEIK